MNFFSRLRVRIPRSASQGLVLLSGVTLAQLLPALASPVLTRLYHPSDFGTFALTFALYGAITPIACLRYEVAIVLPPSEEEATHIACAALAASGLLSLFLAIAAGIVWFFTRATSLASYAAPIFATLPLSVALFGMQIVAQNWSIRLQRFRIQSIALILQAAVMVSVQVAAGFVLGSNTYGLIAGLLLGLLAAVLALLYPLRHDIVSALTRFFSHAASLKAAKDYARFPLYTGPYAFVGQASSRAVLLVLAAFTTTQVVGQFALAQRVIFLPVTTIMNSASQIFYSRAARNLNAPRVEHLVRCLLIAGPLLLGPFFMLAFVFGKPIFATVFGSAWTEAGVFGVILVAPSAFRTLTAWLDRVYDIKSRQRFALLLEIGNGAVTLVALYVALRLTHDPAVGLAYFALASSGFYAIWLLCTLRVASYDVTMWFEFLAAMAAAAVYLFVANSLLALIALSALSHAIALIVLGSPVVAAGAWLMHRAFAADAGLPSLLSIAVALRRTPTE